MRLAKVSNRSQMHHFRHAYTWCPASLPIVPLYRDNIKELERSSTVDLVGIVSRPLIITVSRHSRQRRWVWPLRRRPPPRCRYDIIEQRARRLQRRQKFRALTLTRTTAIVLESDAQMRNVNWRTLERMPVNSRLRVCIHWRSKLAGSLQYLVQPPKALDTPLLQSRCTKRNSLIIEVRCTKCQISV